MMLYIYLKANLFDWRFSNIIRTPSIKRGESVYTYKLIKSKGEWLLDPKSKWNRKHESRIIHHEQPTPNARLKDVSAYLKGGVALDLACGLGANSLFLAQLGYQVQAFDISTVAVDYVKEQAEKRRLPVRPCQCDLTECGNLHIKEHTFDLVVITYYLDRLLFPLVKSIIKENGYFFMETYFMSPYNERRGVSDQYKLQPKELLTVFGDWQVLYYEENEQEGRQTIFVRKKEAKGEYRS